MIKKSPVKPLVPNQPLLAVKIANNMCSEVTSAVTSNALVSTVPEIPSTDDRSHRPITASTLSALISQQAIHNSQLTEEERIKKGVVPSNVGLTIQQLSSAKKILKPGIADFAQKMREKHSDMDLDKVLPRSAFTGLNGVTSLQRLVNDKQLQVGTLSTVIQQSMTDLVEKGVITGKEDEKDISGVVFAASSMGVENIAGMLSNVSVVASTVNSNTDVGKLISSGVFASTLADKASSGVTQISTWVESNSNTSEQNYIPATDSDFESYKNLVSELEQETNALHSAMQTYKNNGTNVALSELQRAQYRQAEVSQKLEKYKLSVGIKVTDVEPETVFQNLYTMVSTSLRDKYSRLSEWYIDASANIGSFPNFKTIIASLASLGGKSKTPVALYKVGVDSENDATTAIVLNSALDAKVPAPAFGASATNSNLEKSVSEKRESLVNVNQLKDEFNKVYLELQELTARYEETLDGSIIPRLQALEKKLNELEHSISIASMKYANSLK